jgi:REP element-mobilizing transposase RayT
MAQNRIALEPGQMYHIWTHANGDDNLFREERNYTYFLDKYSYHIEPVAETYAYCLMPNHLHLMVRVKEENEVLEYLRVKKSNSTLQGFETLGGFSNVISRQFSHLFNGYTQAFNKLYNRKGSLFIPNFKRKLINSENYFGTLIAYIHNNPVHHGFTSTPGQWPHSSWHTYLQKKMTKLKREEGLSWFGGRDEFLRAHQEIVMEKAISLFEE